MSDRTVALLRDGTLYVYAMNGHVPSGPVATMAVGAQLTDAETIQVAAALCDLRDRVLSASAPVARHAPARRALPKPRRHRGAESLNGRVRRFLVDHGPALTAEVAAGVIAEATQTKTGRQRLSTALFSLQHQGHVTRGADLRWRAT